MPAEAIVDSYLFIKRDLNNPVDIINNIISSRLLLGHFSSQLLLYDRLVIPTYDFSIVPILISWIGFDLFDEMLQDNAITFVHRRNLLAYAGNGNAISEIQIRFDEEPLAEPRPWWVKTLFTPVEEAIYLQLINTLDTLNSSQIERIINLTLSHTTNLKYDNDFFIENIANESYRDVMKSKWLSQFVLESNKLRENSIDLRWISDVKPNEVRILSSKEIIRDPVDMILQVAEVNMELLMAYQTGGSDLLTSQGAEILLHDKLARFGAHKEVLEGFQKLIQISDLPDIRPCIVNNEISFSDIWKIRNGINGINFRKWLRVEGPRNSQDFIKAYIRALSNETIADKLPIRMMRLAITTAAGLLPGVGGLIGGLAADAVDNFFIEKWLKGYTPKLFLDEIRKIAPKEKPS